MTRITLTAIALAMTGTMASAQDYYGGEGYIDAGTYSAGPYGSAYEGGASMGSNEPLFQYDDQEQWKHGYQQIMPFYGGFHAGRPYNYHHVFSQTQTSVGWGLPHGLPYSQQWWHQYEGMADPGRAQTEPNGYYGHIPQAAPQQWAQTTWPTAPGMVIAPVQYTQPAPAGGVIR